MMQRRRFVFDKSKRILSLGETMRAAMTPAYADPESKHYFAEYAPLLDASAVGTLVPSRLVFEGCGVAVRLRVFHKLPHAVYRAIFAEALLMVQRRGTRAGEVLRFEDVLAAARAVGVDAKGHCILNPVDADVLQNIAVWVWLVACVATYGDEAHPATGQTYAEHWWRMK